MNIKNNPLITEKLINRITAGIGGAVVAFPLSIGFAIIAGVPEEIMIAASIYAAIINAIFASSRYGIAGPNTAVALITGAAIAPFAPREGDIYMGYVFALCILVALFQFLISIILRKVDIMDYVSNTVIDGLTMGIGAIFILNSINMAAGLSPDITNQWTIFNAFTSFVLILEGDANYYALQVTLVTILVGIICWRHSTFKRFAIPIAVTCGFFAGNLLDLNYDTRIDQVGWMDMHLFATSLPDFRPVSWPVLIELIGPALAIALIGTLQTLSITKTLRDSGEDYNPARETFSQGFQHLFMGFFSGCPVSNSFNKSALQKDLKGDKWSFLITAFITLVFVVVFGSVVAAIPMPALAACMILVGLSMMSPKKHRAYFRSGKIRMSIFLISACSVVILNIPAAIFIGAILSITLYFMTFASPDVHVSSNTEGAIVVKISGAFFFVSGAKLNIQVQKELHNYNLNNAAHVFIDLREAMIFTRDHIDIDWIHLILGENVPVTIVGLSSQKEQISKLQSRGGIPEACDIQYQEAETNLLQQKTDSYGRRKSDFVLPVKT